MVTVLVDSLVREPLVSIISSEPFSIVKVPVVSVKEISNVTVIFPSMMISSEPVGRVSLLQLDGSDHTPVAPPTQPPLATSAGATSTVTVAVSGADEPSSDMV